MILQSLYALYNRLSKDPANNLPSPGYSQQDISIKIILSQAGELIEIQDIRDSQVTVGKNGREKRTSKAITLIVPGKARASEASFDACLLWDDTRFVLGWHGVKNDPARNKKCLESFRKHHYEKEKSLNDVDFTAVCNFLRTWKPQDAVKHPDLLKVKKGRIVFQISGKTEYVHQRKTILDKIVDEKTSIDTSKDYGQCLITGDVDQPIARLHPGILNIPGSPYTGANLVSFNDSAYESHGKEGKDVGRGANSPSSESAVAGYVSALDWLLSKRQKERNFRLIDTTAVYWTEEPTPSETKLPWMIAGVPQAEDNLTKQSIELILKKLAQGTLGQTELGNPEVHFHIVGLSLNQGRLSVRFCHMGNLGELLSNIKMHFDQLSIVRKWDESSMHPESSTPTAFQLLRQTCRDSDGVSPLLSGALLRSILLGTRYPEALVTGVMNRIRVVEKKPKGDGTLENITYLRAAILKAWLMRNHKQWLQHHKIIMKPALDKNTPHVAYQLGRLFAVYEQVQRAAHEFKLERTIRETMFSAASATPQSVFGRLDRLNKYHLAKLTVGSNRHFSGWIDEIHQKITAPNFYPSSLSLKEQGLFCIGYYHQRHEFRSVSKNLTSPSHQTV
jgi:CRISPR-associated protein Csd1